MFDLSWRKHSIAFTPSLSMGMLQFDEAMSESVLLKIIRELEKVDVKVVAIISDMGPKNMRLWRELGISIDSPSMANPADASRYGRCNEFRMR